MGEGRFCTVARDSILGTAPHLYLELLIRRRTQRRLIGLGEERCVDALHECSVLVSPQGSWLDLQRLAMLSSALLVLNSPHLT